jgi:hypothetical protein
MTDDCTPEDPCHEDSCVFCDGIGYVDWRSRDHLFEGDDRLCERCDQPWGIPRHINAARAQDHEYIANPRDPNARCKLCDQPRDHSRHGPAQPSEDRTEKLDRLRAALVDTDGLENIPEPEPLVPGVLYKDSPAWLYGEPGCGKSFVAIDLAGCVGTGEIWQGFGPAVQGQVIYLVAEGVTGIKQRVRAWEGSMGTKMTGVQFLPVAVQASNDSEWQALVDLAAEIRPALIVIDTQARITVGMEENSNTEMGRLVHRIEQLRKASGACVLTIHHTGRAGDHMRGAIAIDGAATTTIKVEKSEDVLNLTCTKQKDAPAFDAFRLRLVSYQESAILSPIHGSVGIDMGQPAVRKMLVEWWDSHETDWVSRKDILDAKIAARETFHRATKALEKTGLVETKGEGSTKRYRLRNKPEL